MKQQQQRPAYVSVAAPASIEQVIKKSRFIADVFPISNADDVAAACQAIHDKHPAATHICYAYKCGLDTQTVRFSDAGEPSGTAGRPILEVIEREQLLNTLVVVTRYFGGVLLGAAGLVRAYAGAASAVIAAAGKAHYEWHATYAITVDYAAWGRVERLLREQGYRFASPQFGAAVMCQCAVPAVQIERWQSMLQDATGGQAVVQYVAEGYLPVQVASAKSTS